tara:strand:- start:381 stop:719 length:339 start_codon:yes stop_codon:yes gene_type:complete
MAGVLYDGFSLSGTVTGGGSTTATLTRAVTFYDFSVYATAANGGGSVTLQNAGVAISDAVAAATDKVVARAGTFDDATISANSGVVITFAGASGADAVATALCYVQGAGANQ